MPSSIHTASDELYTISDLIKWQPPKITRIIYNGIFNVGNKMMIFGDEGGWKSILTQHTALALANGANWFGYETTQSNVLKVQVELPMYSDRDRLLKYCQAHEEILFTKGKCHCNNTTELASLRKACHELAYPENIVSRTASYFHIDEVFAYESLKKNIEICLTHLPSRPLVVILDPLYMLVGGDTNKGIDMQKLISNVNIATEYYSTKGHHIAWIIIHHSKKPDKDESGRPVSGGSNDQSGTRDFQKWADTIIQLSLNPNNSKRVDFKFTKHRNAETDLHDMEIKWNRDTLHPQITQRYLRHDPKDDDEIELRGDELYLALES